MELQLKNPSLFVLSELVMINIRSVSYDSFINGLVTKETHWLKFVLIFNIIVKISTWFKTIYNLVLLVHCEN